MQSYKNAPETDIVVTIRSYPMSRLLSIALLAILITSATAQSTQPKPRAPNTPHPRSPHPRLRHRQRTARRHRPLRQRRRQLHPRPHPQPRARDDRAGRRAAGNRLQLHHELGRQQDLSRHRPRARHLRHAPIPPTPPSSIVTTSHPAPYTRHVAVYVPKQYVPGTAAPFIVGADGPDRALFTALDNLIAEHKVPVMIAISIGNGSGDAQGSERGLEYDTMSGRYAEFVENRSAAARRKAMPT